MKARSLSLFGKIFCLVGLVVLVSAGGIFIVFNHLAASGEQASDAVRELTEARARVDLLAAPFFADPEGRDGEAVVQGFAALQDALKPYRAEKEGKALQKAVAAYSETFVRLAEGVRAEGGRDGESAAGRMEAGIQDVEQVFRDYYYKMFLIDVLQARQAEKNYVIYRQDAYAEEVRTAVASLLERTERTALPRGIKDKISVGLNEYLDAFDVFIATLQSGGREQELQEARAAVDGPWSAFMERREEEAQARQHALLLAIGLLGALGLVVAFLLARLIVRPVKRLDEAAERVASGAADRVEDVRAAGDVGRLVQHYNEMARRISEATEALQEKSAHVAAAEQRTEAAVQEGEARHAALSREIDHLLGEMERFAEGDLALPAAHDADERDEAVSRLYAGFRATAEAVGNVLLHARQAVEETSQTVGQVSTFAEELSAGVQEQSAQAAEVAAAVEEMTATIIENARNARHTAEAAQASGAAAETGGAVVQRTVTKIREIAAIVSTSAETIERLGTSSEQIGQIVQVIDEIADQTNLLALNAAIEAARAGEQGRGFAVVADEVRKLAERTTGATKQIARMVKGIQSETGAAVQAMQRGTNEVEAGIRLADQAGEALGEIVARARETVGMIHQIAVASEQQSSTSEQISCSVESISTVSMESARGINEITRAGDVLQHHIDHLQSLLARFHRRARSHPPHNGAASGSRSPHLRRVAAGGRDVKRMA